MKRKPSFSRLLRILAAVLLLTAAMGTIAFAAGGGRLKQISYWFSGTWKDVISDYDTDGNGCLSEEEIDTIEDVDVHGMGLNAMTGRQLLTSLWCLDCSDNELTSLVFYDPQYFTLAKVNVFSQPKSGANVIATIPDDEVVTVTGFENIYAEIRFQASNGDLKTGYVSMNALTLIGGDDIPLQILSCYGNSLRKLDITHLPYILDAYLNGTKDTSDPDYDQYESELGLLLVDKDVRIIAGSTEYTVRWFDLEGNVLDEKTYWDTQDEPSTDRIPAPLPDGHYRYEFSGWDEGSWVNSTEKEYWPESVYAVNPGVSGSFSGGVLTAEVYARGGSRLIAASYDAAGRLLGVRIREIASDAVPMTLSFAGLQTKSGGVCKLLLTDGNWLPLCPQWAGSCP